MADRAVTEGDTKIARLANWAGNHPYASGILHEPTSGAELQELVRGASAIRALGTRHAFNALADSRGDLVSLRRLPRRMDIDEIARTVTIDGAMTYGELCPRLDAAGFALHSLASLPHISVAGAIATGTHGSGDASGSLATAVVGLELVAADGELRTLRASDPGAALEGAVVSLGALGIVSALTLAIEPSYSMRQDVFEDVPMAAALDRFDEVTASGDAVSLFTDWSSGAFHQVWVKRRTVEGTDVDVPPALRDARRAIRNHHPIPGLSSDACTPQLGSVGPWHERLAHFRLDHVPSAGAELQSEYLVDRRHAPQAIAAVAALADRLAPMTWVSEIRTIAADELWLSPAFGTDTVAIHFTWKPEWRTVRGLMRIVERALEPFGPRPHWGKLFSIAPDRVRGAYPQRRDFVELAERLDPRGKFGNAFVDRFVLGTSRRGAPRRAGRPD